MLVIKVWCLPAGQTEESLQKLHQSIVAGVASIPELGLKGQQDMTCLFPADLMTYCLGEEIIVEISGLYNPERKVPVRFRLAECIGKRVKALYPKARVEVTILTPVNPDMCGWRTD